MTAAEVGTHGPGMGAQEVHAGVTWERFRPEDSRRMMVEQNKQERKPCLSGKASEVLQK